MTATGYEPPVTGNDSTSALRKPVGVAANRSFPG
jgi:hypothetical protein